jgi:hypothetical protein
MAADAGHPCGHGMSEFGERNVCRGKGRNVSCFHTEINHNHLLHVTSYIAVNTQCPFYGG